MGYQIEYYPRVEGELRKIRAWIVRHVGPFAAERFMEGISERVQRLKTFPGPGRRDSGNPGYLFFVARGHRFYYRVEDESRRVVIVRVWPATRPPPILGD